MVAGPRLPQGQGRTAVDLGLARRVDGVQDELALPLDVHQLQPLVRLHLEHRVVLLVVHRVQPPLVELMEAPLALGLLRRDEALGGLGAHLRLDL